MAGEQVLLGSLLVEMGFIQQAELDGALSEQKQTGLRLGKILIQSGRITEDRLVHALSRQLGIEACDPIMTPVHEAVLAMVPATIAFERRVLPVARKRDGDREVLYVATADPLDDEALRALRSVVPAQTTVHWMLAGETEMDLALARHYGAAPTGAGAQRSSAPAPVAAKPQVITGLPVSAPPRRPDEPSVASMKSTGDIFAALQEAVELSDPRPAPVVATMAARPADDGPVEAGADVSHPSIDLARLQGELHDDVAEEILVAEEVVESGIYSPEELADDAEPLPPVEFPPPPPPEAAAPAAEAPAEAPAWPPSTPSLSTGSWGDLLDTGHDDEEDEAARAALRNLAAEATELPTATDSVPGIPADTARPPDPEASEGPALASAPPPTELELAPEIPTAIPSEAPATDEATMFPAPAAPDPSTLERTEVDEAYSLSGSLDLPIEDALDELDPAAFTSLDADVGLDGRPLDAPSEEAPPAAESGADEARTLVRRFVAGGALSPAQSTWVLRLVAGLALESGLLADEALAPVLGRLGSPPSE